MIGTYLQYFHLMLGHQLFDDSYGTNKNSVIVKMNERLLMMSAHSYI